MIYQYKKHYYICQFCSHT